MKLIHAGLEGPSFTHRADEIATHAAGELDADDELIFPGFFPFDANASQRCGDDALGELKLARMWGDPHALPARLGRHDAEQSLHQVIDRRSRPGVAVAFDCGFPDLPEGCGPGIDHFAPFALDD